MDAKKLIICPNCNNEIEESCNYCPICGQANRKLNLNLRFIISELLSANFNLDNKIVLTIKKLVIAPGFLTREYLSGKRAKYISPIRLYLLISFIYFFVLSLDFNIDRELISGNADAVDSYEPVDSLQTLNVFDVVSNDSIGMEMDTANTFNNWFVEVIKEKSNRLDSESGGLMFKGIVAKIHFHWDVCVNSNYRPPSFCHI